MAKILLILILIAPSINAAGPRWDNSIDINAPDLTVSAAQSSAIKA